MIRLLTFCLLAVALAACSSSSNRSTGTRAVYAPPGVWTLAYSPTTALLSGPSFIFPGDSQGVDYLLEGPAHPIGQTITVTFTVDGAGTLTPTESADTEPHPRVRLFFQRTGDDLSAQGDLASYRWWSTDYVDIDKPGVYTLTANLTPDQWTNVYGQPGTGVINLFSAAVAGVSNIGMTFGGNFAGHGIFCSAGGPMKFTMVSYSY